MADLRGYDEDKEAGVPTIPSLIGSPHKAWIVLTVVQAAVMMTFFRNLFIARSSYNSFRLYSREKFSENLLPSQSSLIVDIYCHERSHRKLDLVAETRLEGFDPMAEPSNSTPCGRTSCPTNPAYEISSTKPHLHLVLVGLQDVRSTCHDHPSVTVVSKRATGMETGCQDVIEL
ncbi:hypothetical protein BDR04DRAFT_1235533 [Suillus decipiens]|nr:hypothetical protein BDR04DRAFT_1235533 [Suillus decipiens]